MNTSSDDIQPAANAQGADNANAQPACRNCGAPMLGAHCYACGQPVKGLVRPLGNLFGDLLDSVFNVDTRILRTLPPLFAKPGFLTTEYFAGRQVRYVTPVRLFFFHDLLGHSGFTVSYLDYLTGGPGRGGYIGTVTSKVRGDEELAAEMEVSSMPGAGDGAASAH